MNPLKICIVGATGNVGRKVVELILQRNIATLQDLTLLASKHSAGKKLNIAGHEFPIEATTNEAFTDSTICIFNTESDVSAQFVPIALNAGAYVIDSSSHYRLHPEVPLIIPPVNAHLICKQQKLYAHANCLASPIATVLGPLHRAFGLKRVNATTYQSTSGAGKNAMDECYLETKSLIEQKPYQRSCFHRQIAFNVIPQVGNFRDDGFTYEEYKIMHEVKKVLGEDILVSATAVRVPVMVGHSIALNVEFKNNCTMAQLLTTLQKSPFVKLSAEHYSTPVEVVNSDDVFVGRIRQDNTTENGYHLWTCSDNLRRGAAVDAIEILSTLSNVLNETTGSQFQSINLT